jgi:hypothetical protein
MLLEASIRVTSLKSFVPGTLTTRDGLAMMTARRMQEAILAATINSANLDWNLEKRLKMKGFQGIQEIKVRRLED